MTKSWAQTRLGDVVKIRHGFAFSGKHFSDTPTKNVLVTPGNFEIGGGFKSNKLKFYDGPVPEEYILSSGDLIVTMTYLSKNMDTLGYPALVPDLPDGRQALHNQRIGLIVITSPLVDKGWLSYRLRAADYRSEILASSTGTTVHHTSPGRIENFEFAIPPIEVQQSITATLDALDSKIASNKRSVDIAETLADALFTRSQGEHATLSDVASLTMGSSPPGSSYTDQPNGGLPFYQGVRDFGRRFPSLRVWTNQPIRIAEPNDTLLSVRAPVGQLNRASVQCCIGRGVAAIRSAWPSTIYYALRASTDFWEPFQQEGTVFGAINRADLASAKLPWPSHEMASELEAALESIDRQISHLENEIAKLSSLRDALLPELLSGRIRVAADEVES